MRNKQHRVGVLADQRLVAELDPREFTALRYFALNGTDHRSHTEQNRVIAGYVHWRNARARPKRHFAINSPIHNPIT